MKGEVCEYEEEEDKTGACVSEGEPVSLPTLDTLPDEGVSLVQLTQTAVKKAIIGLDEQKGLRPDGISPSILRKLIGCQGSADTSGQSVLIDWYFSCCLERILCRSDFEEWREAGYLFLSWDIHFVGDTKTF
jgi:hypothetical protein